MDPSAAAGGGGGGAAAANGVVHAAAGDRVLPLQPEPAHPAPANLQVAVEVEQAQVAVVVDVNEEGDQNPVPPHLLAHAAPHQNQQVGAQQAPVDPDAGGAGAVDHAPADENQVGDKVGDEVGDKVGDEVGVGAQQPPVDPDAGGAGAVDDAPTDENQVGDKVGDEVGDKVGDEVGDKVGDKVGDEVGDEHGQLVDSTADSVRVLARQPPAAANPMQQLAGGDDAAAAAAAAAQPAHLQPLDDWLAWMLAGLTVVVLAAVLVAELGLDVTSWPTTLQAMTGEKWTIALLLAIGDTTSLGLTYTPAWRFHRMWRGEGLGVAAGIAALVPPVVALINNTDWFCYGLAVAGTNGSVAIINGTAVVFQSLYVYVFCARSDVPRARKVTVLLLGAGVSILIAIVDAFFLRGTLGFKLEDALSWSGACTSIATYCFLAVVNMVAAHVNRGADGVTAQVLATLANALVWFAYASATDNLGMQVANGVGVLSFLLQAGQLLAYRFRKPPQEDERDDDLRRRLLENQV